MTPIRQLCNFFFTGTSKDKSHHRRIKFFIKNLPLKTVFRTHEE